MTTLLPLDADSNPIPALRLRPGGAHSIGAASASSARNAAAFGNDTRIVSVYADVPVYLRFGDSSVSAATTDHFFPEATYYDFALGGDATAHYTHLAVRATGTSGTVYISEKE